MKSMTLGLALSLIGGAAMAQTPPAPQPRQPAGVPAAAPAPQPAQAGGPGQGAVAAQGAPQPAQSGPPEGMIVETPSGFYLVRPGEASPRRLDIGPQGRAPGAIAQTGPDGQPGGEPMDDVADEGPQPPPPRPHGGMPPRPPEGKGARFRIKTPNLTLGMKCPDDEPVKACIDAVSQLLDKTAAQPH